MRWGGERGKGKKAEPAAQAPNRAPPSSPACPSFRSDRWRRTFHEPRRTRPQTLSHPAPLSPPCSFSSPPSSLRSLVCQRVRPASSLAILPLGRQSTSSCTDWKHTDLEAGHLSVFPPLLPYSPPPPFWGRQMARAVDVPTNEPPSLRLCPSSHPDQPSLRLLACLPASLLLRSPSSNTSSPLPPLPVPPLSSFDLFSKPRYPAPGRHDPLNSFAALRRRALRPRQEVWLCHGDAASSRLISSAAHERRANQSCARSSV
ncbi:hypothetical protein AAT19DRAFT_11923 [Rhodotorula toruloides]|uniref:Uncharacterized protein n=1 Tax=Rhodotorula toruloides TaxID=5286 RepID=A0A2T0AES3_RHOTO|nr:hypothetical protein AAT19DRAFT_11923 [Rhodotorula toruloides]